QRISIDGVYAYVALHKGGIEVLDISSPMSPTVVWTYSTPSFAEDVVPSVGHIYVADYDAGLTVLHANCSTPTSVRLSSFQATPQPGSILLEWHVTTDTDISMFRVERSLSITGEYVQRGSDVFFQGSPSYQFRDTEVTPGKKYFYRLAARDRSGK